MLFSRFDMRNGEDGFLAKNLECRLGLKAGIIREAVCLHASGPVYAREYGHLDREIEKYARSGMRSFVEEYAKYRDEEAV